MTDIAGNMASIDDIEIEGLVKQGKKKEAIDKANSFYQKYNQSQDPLFKQLAMYIKQKIGTLEGKQEQDSTVN